MGPKGGSYSWYRNRIFQDFDEMKGDHPAGIRMKVAHTAGKETITITVRGRRSGPAECAERLNKSADAISTQKGRRRPLFGFMLDELALFGV